MGNVIMKAQQITYGASNVEKALDDLKAPELIELNKRMDAIDAWKANVHEETYTGSELTIENALALPARSLITEINAIQDLHDLPFPYVGGAYKNKLPYDLATMKTINTDGTWNDNVYTVGGVSFTVADGVVYLSGTATELVMLYIAPNIDDALVADASYILTGAIDGNIQVGISQKGFDSGSGLTFVNSFTISDPSVRINIASGTNTNNKIVKPMIRLSTESDATFAPYSNICPISGRTAAVITRSDGDEISEDFTIQLGTTVYDGNADITEGEGSSRTGKYTLNGTENINWSLVNTEPTRQVIYANIQSVLTNPKITGRKQAGGKFNMFYYADNYAVGVAFIDANNGAWLNMAFEPNKFADSAAFNTWLASNNIEFTYELATPTTIQLTPTQLEMLKGYNRITVASGYATIELKALVLGGDN